MVAMMTGKDIQVTHTQTMAMVATRIGDRATSNK